MIADPEPVPGFPGALREGDPAAVDWLAARCRRRAAPRFSAWAWAWIQDDFVADLTVQLLQAFSRPGFELEGPHQAYVDRAIHNLCSAYFRRVARVRSQDELPASGPATTADPLLRIAAALDLRRALLAVGPECRRRLVDKYVLGLSLEEMARAESVSSQTLRSRLHACRERVREFWFRHVEGRRK